MPTEIKLYECNICKQQYKLLEHAIDCENQVIPEALPVGLVFGNADDPSHLYHNITFAVAESKLEGHYRYDLRWACRDTPHGDSLGRERCGGDTVHLYKGNAASPTHPTFRRMVKWLQSQDIPVTVWNGEAIVPLDEFLREKGVQLD